jgi:hypothetical protein
VSGFDVGRDGIWFLPESAQDAAQAVRFLDFATGAVRTRSVPLGRVSGDLSVSPDGRRAMYSRTDRSGCDLMLVENFR